MKLRTKKNIYDFESREELIKSLKENKRVCKQDECFNSGAWIPYQKVDVDLENQTVSFKCRYSSWGGFETATVSFEKLDFKKYELVEYL